MLTYVAQHFNKKSHGRNASSILFSLLYILLLSGCATSYVAKKDKTQSEHEGCACSKQDRLTRAIALDFEITKAFLEAAVKELKESNAHSSSSLDEMCEHNTEKKICTAKMGCYCQAKQ